MTYQPEREKTVQANCKVLLQLTLLFNKSFKCRHIGGKGKEKGLVTYKKLKPQGRTKLKLAVDE